MAPGAEERIRELTQRMLRRKLYVVFSTATGGPDRIKEILPLHLEYMIGLEKRGHVFASGPLADGEGPPTGLGLTVLRAKDAKEARALAEADPFFINGLRHYGAYDIATLSAAVKAARARELVRPSTSPRRPPAPISGNQ